MCRIASVLMINLTLVYYSAPFGRGRVLAIECTICMCVKMLKLSLYSDNYVAVETLANQLSFVSDLLSYHRGGY